jgi:serine/threonine protein kinase
MAFCIRRPSIRPDSAATGLAAPAERELPLSLTSQRRQLAADVADLIGDFTPSSSSTIQPRQITVLPAVDPATPAIFLNTLFRRVDEVKELMRDRMRDFSPASQQSLHNLECMIDRIEAYLESIPVFKEEEAANAKAAFYAGGCIADCPRTIVPAHVKHCEKFVSIVQENLFILKNCMKELSASGSEHQTLALPRRLEHFAWLRASTSIESLDELGRGAFGIVSRVHHRDQRPEDAYVIKHPFSEADIEDELNQMDFSGLSLSEQEAIENTAYSKLMDQQTSIDYETLFLFSLPRHPGIVEFFGATEKGLPMLECLKGSELFDTVKSKSLTDAQKYAVAQEIAHALAKMHQHRRVHCDLKLDNVRFATSSNQSPKILDFGFSAFTPKQLTRERQFGTDLYAAPEVLNPRPTEKDESLDVWSYGNMLFLLISSDVYFYDELFYSYHKRYRQDSDGDWDHAKLWDFVTAHVDTIESKIEETIKRLETRKGARLRLPEQERKALFSVLRGCLKFEPGERLSMEQVKAIFAQAPASRDERSSSHREFATAEKAPIPAIQRAPAVNNLAALAEED